MIPGVVFLLSPTAAFAVSLAALALAPAAAVALPRPVLFRPRLTAWRPAPPWRLPDGLENLRQSKIDLTALEVNANDLHSHAVAEAIHAAVLLAPQDVRAFDKPVVIIGHRRDVHHTFDEVLNELDVEAECAHARDVAFELIADLVGHESNLFPLHELALGVGGTTLAL